MWKQVRQWQQKHPRLFTVAEWGLLFVALVLALWAATQRRDAPQLILLALLTIITLNFSLPPSRAGVGLTPVVSVGSLLILGWETAVLLLLVSLFLAELVHPLWYPVWDDVLQERPSRRRRWGQGVILLLALLAGGWIYRVLGGSAPLAADYQEQLRPFLGLAAGYGVTYWTLSAGYWRLQQRPFAAFLRDHGLNLFIIGFLGHPFALLAAVTFTTGGLPVFILFSLGMMAFSAVTWLSWQRRLILETQLAQFDALNRAGASLRETLELPTVLRQTYRQVADLIPIDAFDIHLRDEDGRWRQHRFQPPTTSSPSPTPRYPADDFTRWVVRRNKMLVLDRGNLHFAARHHLKPPHPRPDAWLGLPLTSAETVIGVMVLQRYGGGLPFSRWQRELLLAIAGQASAAIQNARLHSETVRLYNRTDQALARRLEQLQALLQSMAEGVLLLDNDSRILLVNPPAATLLGRPAETLRGQLLPFSIAPHIGYTKADLTYLLNRLAVGRKPAGQTVTYERTEKQDNGRSRRFITRQETAVLAEDGRVMGWLMLFRDVTEEQELAEQRADLTHMIVHDLRNPLTTLINTLDLAQDRIDRQQFDALPTLLTDARRNTGDMLDMVDSLMDINRMEAGRLVVDAEAMRLPPLVARVVRRLQPLAAQKQIALTFTCPDNLPAVWADAELIRRVLVNLLDNALKFTPAHGQINGRLQPEPPLAEGQEAGVRCIISDTGSGIPAKYRDQIFERFMRTNPGGAQVRGTGLGLTFCKLTIEGHNGRIWVEDSPDGGSQFVFTLPGPPAFKD